MKTFLTIIVLCYFVNAGFGQVKCTKIPKNYCGECAYYYKNKKIQKIVTVENGQEVEKLTSYTESGRIAAIKDFRQQNELTGSLQSYDPLTGNVMAKMDFNRGTGTFEYSLNDYHYLAHFTDGKPSGDWTKSGRGVILKSVQSHLLNAPVFNNLSHIYTFTLLSFINFLDSDNFSYDPYNGDHDLMNRVNEVYRLSVAGNFEIQPADIKVESISTSDSIVDFADQEATFVGGQDALQLWISNNFYYPPEAVENNIYGKVYIGFIVERDGSISNVRVQKRVHESLDKEAIRLVLTMPKWNPGLVKGKPGRIKCTVPINFSMN